MNALATLPLHQIEQNLMELLALAEEPELDAEAKAAVDKQIAAYFTAEVRKVDNIAAAVRRCKSAAEEARNESKRLAAIADAWEARERRIKENALYAMATHGVKVLETPTNKLRVQVNGGLQPLELDPSREVDEYCDVNVKLSITVWCDMIKASVQAEVLTERQAQDLENRSKIEPNNALIREALKRGPVAGAKLLPRGVSLRVE